MIDLQPVFCEEGGATCDSCRSVELRGGLFALEYVRLIVALPALRLELRAPAPPAAWPADGARPENGLRFAFGGDEPGEGAIMPRLERARHHLDLQEGAA